MGKQSRQRAERREARQSAGRATQLLRELFEKIRRHTHESGRRSWELMLEILAYHAGVHPGPHGFSSEATKLLSDLGNIEPLLVEYLSAWQSELQRSADSGSPISDPIGKLLEENGGTNEHLGQFFTPPEVVRLMNALTFGNGGEPQRAERVLDPCCGSGRFALDALVHRPRAILYNVDIDLWMMRAALLNFRLAPRFSVAHVNVPDDSGRSQRVVVPSGRSWILRANSLFVDLECLDNWRYSWLWSPPRWQSTMKIAEFDGTYEDYRRQKPRREVDAREEKAAKARSAKLVDLQFDEARLHAEMIRAAKSITIPGAPNDLRADLFSGSPSGTSSSLSFSEPAAALPLLRGRGR